MKRPMPVPRGEALPRSTGSYLIRDLEGTLLGRLMAERYRSTCMSVKREKWP